MRKFLYPIFLLCFLAIIYYFFGSKFSPVVEKLVFVLAIVILFFLFRAIFSFVFGFLIDSFSFLVKTILSLLFFLLILWAVWVFLPENIKTKISDIFTQSEEVTKEVSNTLDQEISNILNKDNNQEVNDKNQKPQENPMATPSTTVSIDHTLKNGNTSKKEGEENNGNGDEKSNENDGNQENQENLDQENNEENHSDESIITWKKPRVEDSNTSVKKMKDAGAILTSSGSSTKRSIITFETADAQMVFPAETILSSITKAQNTDKETVDTIAFSVITSDNTAQVEILLKNSGGNFEQYFSKFSVSHPDENKFYIADQSKNSLTYVTFFEGILWEIRITLDQENPTNDDFYKILLPISFEKKD